MYVTKDSSRILQGDIFESVEINISEALEAGGFSVLTMTFPYAVVLSQDCDLEWDFQNRSPASANHDKRLQSILVCPAFPSDQLKNGNHMQELGLQMQYWSSDQWKYIKQNMNPRFHFLRKSDSGEPFNDLALDFKQYYTLTREEFYQKNMPHYITSLKELYRENLSQRFAFYLSRIGLPEEVITLPNGTPPPASS